MGSPFSLATHVDFGQLKSPEILWHNIFSVWSRMVHRYFGQVKFELSWGGETDGGGGHVAAGGGVEGGGGGGVDGGSGVEDGGGERGQDNLSAVTTSTHNLANFEASIMQVRIRQVLLSQYRSSEQKGDNTENHMWLNLVNLTARSSPLKKTLV